MTDEGPNLEYWHREISNHEHRMKFSISMIRKIIQGLKQLHEFGYAHGDLKMANICSRLKQNGEFKYTLIDLGVTMRLP